MNGRDRDTDEIVRVAEQALRKTLRALPASQRDPYLLRLRVQLGQVLSRAPCTGQDTVGMLRIRAALAAALRVTVPGSKD
ncbi:hypothetical protein VQH23_12430 [Pararoseomonas sp. SCSIO 73927]|uniref:hypothetical protein n=1 Tax=Pararoseomonas sp. SCSIO 73927 TaxID=3114537 RepID=UPI0030CBAC3A